MIIRADSTVRMASPQTPMATWTSSSGSLAEGSSSSPEREVNVGGVVLRFPNQVERVSDLTGHYKRLVGAVYGERRGFVICHVPFSTQAVQALAHS